MLLRGFTGHRGMRCYVALVITPLLLTLGFAVVALVTFGLLIRTLSLRNQLRENGRALEKSQRAATTGMLTAGFAHEMKNSLTVVLGFSELARTAAERSAQADPKLLPHLQELEREAHKTVAQLQSFLLYAGGAPIVRKAHDLNAIGKETLAMIRPMAGLKDLLIEETFGEIPQVDCDPLALRNLLINLLLNALDFAKSKITLATAPGKDGSIELTLSDDGPGIPESLRAHVFDRFFTTRKDGSGMGLSTAREIARAHRGSLTLQDGASTIFLLKLPPH